MAKYKMYLAKQEVSWRYYGEIEIDTDDIPELDGLSVYDTKKNLGQHCGAYEVPDEEGKMVNLRSTLDNQSEKDDSPQCHEVYHYIVKDVDEH